jgi:competence protein ComEC
VDAGSSSIDDVGRRIVAPTLRALGVSKIDVLCLSHADADHVNGAAALLDQFSVGRVVHPPGFERDPASGPLLDRARRRRVGCYAVAAGAILADSSATRSRLVVLHPPRAWKGRRDLARNDTSLVVAVEGNGRRVLLTGDIEEAGITALLARRDLVADAIVLPHHGAWADNLEDLLDAAAAAVVVVSAREGFTPPGVLEHLARRGIAPWRTWASGRVLLVLADRDLRVSGFVATGASP